MLTRWLRRNDRSGTRDRRLSVIPQNLDNVFDNPWDAYEPGDVDEQWVVGCGAANEPVTPNS
jgi:IMP cyclohydrolase